METSVLRSHIDIDSLSGNIFANSIGVCSSNKRFIYLNSYWSEIRHGILLKLRFDFIARIKPLHLIASHEIKP